MTVACRLVCSAGRATLTTVLSMKAMLEPRIVAARIQRPACGEHRSAGIRGTNDGFIAWLFHERWRWIVMRISALHILRADPL